MLLWVKKPDGSHQADTSLFALYVQCVARGVFDWGWGVREFKDGHESRGVVEAEFGRCPGETLDEAKAYCSGRFKKAMQDELSDLDEDQ